MRTAETSVSPYSTTSPGGKSSKYKRSIAPPSVHSIGEAEMQHVAVGDDVILALQPELAGLARPRLAAARDIIVIADGLGANEAFFEIGVDHPRRLRRLRALLDR